MKSESKKYIHYAKFMEYLYPLNSTFTLQKFNAPIAQSNVENLKLHYAKILKISQVFKTVVHCREVWWQLEAKR